MRIELRDSVIPSLVLSLLPRLPLEGQAVGVCCSWLACSWIMSLLPFAGGFLCFRSSPHKRTWMRTLWHPKAPAAAVWGAEGMSWQREPLLRPCYDSYKALSAKTHPQSNHQRSLQVQSSTSLTKISMKPWKGWTNLPSLKTLRIVCIMTMLMFSITRNLISTGMTGCCKLWWTFWGRKIKMSGGPKLEIVMLFPSR